MTLPISTDTKAVIEILAKALMLPLLALPVVGRKRKQGDAIYFKAYVKGTFRKLSNLFGMVEWKFQAAKFKEGSKVHQWLLDGAGKNWTVDEFDEVRVAMKHEGKLASYVADGEVASGLLAQMCSLIVRNPESPIARKRLGYILGVKVDNALMVAWWDENVKDELEDSDKDILMLKLLREKFGMEPYKNLLMETGERDLHEAKGRGAPNRYEFHPLEDRQVAHNAQLVASGESPKFLEGGDSLGRLMTKVRKGLLQGGIAGDDAEGEVVDGTDVGGVEAMATSDTKIGMSMRTPIWSY